MDIPSAIYAHCDACGETTLHHVLKGRAGKKGIDMKIRCSCCKNVNEYKKKKNFVDVKFIISEEEKSRIEMVRMDRDEIIGVNDIIQTLKYPVLVTSIEVNGKRRKKAKASDNISVWSKRYDVIVVKFSLNRSGITTSIKKRYDLGMDICIGDEIIHKRRKYIIHSIKTDSKLLRKGCAPVHYIKRVYAKETTTQ